MKRTGDPLEDFELDLEEINDEEEKCIINFVS